MSSNGAMNTRRMSYYEKDNLRFEVLAGVSMCEKLENKHEEDCAKDMLTNV